MSPSARDLAPRARFDASPLRPESRLVSAAGAWSFGRRVDLRAGLASTAVLAHEFRPAASDDRVRHRSAEPWLETLVAAWELPTGTGAGAGADDRR